MRKTSSFLVLAVLLGLAAAAAASPGAGPAALASSQGTELWGGPGAKGIGNQGARFDTLVYVTAAAPAAGGVDFYAGGSVVATAPFTVAGNGVAVLATPDALAGKGAFLYRVRSDVPVSAWSETYNDTASGRFGVSLAAVPPAELLAPGDEATGGGADASASADPGRGRTNVGVLCVESAGQPCHLEVAVFSGGALAGTGAVEAVPGSAAQASIASLVPEAVDRPGLAFRLRLLSGRGLPYAVRNDNRTSDGTAIPLAVRRNAFSTAPTIAAFTASPATGCAPLETTFAWETTGAARVSISGVGSDLPPTGTAKATVLATGDFLLTATSSTGQTATKPLRVTITPSTPAPTPAPASTTVVTGGVVTGVLPAGTGPVTVTFTKQESTGSTFTVQGTAWVYTAGSTPGVDVVQITASGSCGTASAEFTAAVTTPGAPRIVTFESLPARGCAPSTGILLTWQTENVAQVMISGFEDVFAANGGVETTITGTTTFTLTAWGTDHTRVTAKLEVVVDPRLYVPLLAPSLVYVAPAATVVFDVDPGSVPSVADVRWTVVQMQSRGWVEPDPEVPGRFIYHAGPWGGVDVVRIIWVNGCGLGYSDFVAQVNGPVGP